MNDPRKPVLGSEPRRPALPSRLPSSPTLPADRSFKVLQPSRMAAQLSLFPPPGLVRTGR